MKFFHIADVHLGMRPEKSSLSAEKRERELFESFYNIVRRAGDEKADLLLIAGDLFHRQPKVRELKEIDSCFAAIPNVKVVLIAGNHDYLSGSSPYRDFKWLENVTFIDSAEVTSVFFADINTRIYGFSYHTRNLRENILNGISAENNGNINILLAHGGDPDNVPFTERDFDNSGFDYVALGHIHKAGKTGKLAMYPGSPEPLDKNETGKHGYVIGNIIKDTETEIQFIESASREYIKEAIPVDSHMTNVDVERRIGSFIAEKGSNNYYCFELVGRRDPEITFDTVAMLGRRCFASNSALTLLIDSDKAGEVLEIVDKSVPDYDFDKLLESNKDNVIGMYIDEIKKTDVEDEIIQKALYYGVAALQGTL